VSRGEIAGTSHWTPPEGHRGMGANGCRADDAAGATWDWGIAALVGAPACGARTAHRDGHCGGYEASDYAAAAPGGSMALRQDYASVIHRALPPVVEIKQRPGLARADWSRVGGFLN
jgi:hypothetical protein